MDKLTSVEQHYKAENKALKEALEQMTHKYESLETIYLSLKEELDQTYTRL